MCGRFTLRSNPRALAKLFEVDEPLFYAPRYNIAPTQPVAVVRLNEARDKREWALTRWGLVPHWTKSAPSSAPLINARADTLAEKPAFRDAFRHRRCVIPADGFFEWRQEDDRKQPIYITMIDDAPFGLAGVWESWQAPDGTEIESCAIITTEANALLRTIHDRMPVILPPTRYSAWLDVEHVSPNEAWRLLQPYDAFAMKAAPVSSRVNSARVDDEQLITPVTPPPRQATLFD